MRTKDKGQVRRALAAALVSMIMLHQGCAIPAPGNAGRAPAVHPAIIVLTEEQAREAGLPQPPGRGPAAPPMTGSAVAQGRGAPLLRPPVVRAYQVGRTRDPADPRLLHEAHTVYRIEEDGDWELDPGTAVQPGGESAQDTPQRPEKRAVGKCGDSTEGPQAGAPQAR